MKGNSMNIVDYLTTPGNFVRTPDNRIGCVIGFNVTTNEVEISYAAIGLMQEMSREARQEDQFLDDLRNKRVIVSHHFSKLRVGKEPT